MENYTTMQESEEVMNSICMVAVSGPVKIGNGPIEAPDMSDTEAQDKAERIERLYKVDVAMDTPGCCIDGRDCVCRLDNSETAPGPKCAGGPLITAYAAAKLTGWFGGREMTISEELTEIKDTLESAGIVIGGHCDQASAESSFSQGGTGCGADDKLPLIIENIGSSKMRPLITGGVEMLLGGDQNSVTQLESVINVAANTPVSADSWDATKMIDVLGDSKLEVLQGAHAEEMVVVNYEENTTVDRDAVCKHEGTQVFALDMWYVEKIAAALAKGPFAEQEYGALLHAATAYQVGTLGTLGSGNHRIAQLTPQQAAN